MAFLVAVVIGAVLGGIGYLVAPRETCPGWARTLVAGMAGALPGVLVAAIVLDDKWMDVDPSSLAVSILGATLAVMAVAFVRERTHRADAGGYTPSNARE